MPCLSRSPVRFNALRRRAERGVRERHGWKTWVEPDDEMKDMKGKAPERVYQRRYGPPAVNTSQRPGQHKST